MASDHVTVHLQGPALKNEFLAFGGDAGPGIDTLLHPISCDRGSNGAEYTANDTVCAHGEFGSDDPCC